MRKKEENLKKAVFEYKEEFLLEKGDKLESFQLYYEILGNQNLNHDKIIWVCHALTGNATVTDWWEGLFGVGKLYNPEEYTIICANSLGGCYGSTGPLSLNPETGIPYYNDFPVLTNRDIIKSFDLLRHHLGIKTIHTLIGGSLGGQQALEWSILVPNLSENLIIIASNAFHSPWGIAFNESQRMAISLDKTWGEKNERAGLEGMKIARTIALLSYRSYDTYLLSQKEDEVDKTDNYKASSYQVYQGEKLSKRFNAFSYWVLSKAMDSHNVGRNKGSAENALKKITARTLVIGVNSDLLFPIVEQQFIANNIPNASFEEINSCFGHDGFLIEFPQIEKSISSFYNKVSLKFENK